MEELKDYVMAEMLWDPSLDPDILITEFLDGYYEQAGPYIRRYMDTMHEAVNETCPVRGAYIIQPPAGILKCYLTPKALLTSATAFKDGLNALNPSQSAVRGRVRRASMAVSYVVLWRWASLREFASNNSIAWPYADDKEAAFTDFAEIYNATGLDRLTGGTQNRGEDALRWLHKQLFEPPGPPPAPSPAQGLYAEIVLDECSASAGECQLANFWTAVPSSRPNMTIFKSGLSIDGNSSNSSCYAINVPGIPIGPNKAQVLAYGDATRMCDTDAVQNTFGISGGLLGMTRAYHTSACSAVFCCITAVQGSEQVVMGACDGGNPLQHFDVHNHQIRHKASGRCLATKNCQNPHAATLKTDDDTASPLAGSPARHGWRDTLRTDAVVWNHPWPSYCKSAAVAPPPNFSAIGIRVNADNTPGIVGDDP